MKPAQLLPNLKFRGTIIMSVFRYLFLAFATALLMIVISCSQTPNTADNSTPAPGAASSPATTIAENQTPGQPKININTAILSELDKLEAKLGVPALSHRIQANRPYGGAQDLVSKKVITQEQFDQVKDLVTTEDIVLTGVAKDVDYMTKLGLMKGHMSVAKELLDLKKPEQAEPHIGHPVEEIYVDVQEQFQERKVPDFKDKLIRLQDLVKSKPNDPQLKTEFDAAMTAIDQAIAALPNEQRQSPAFVLQVINGLLDTASAEYTAAISNGKITEAIEYQDSRGFVDYAHNTLYKGIEAPLTKESPKTHEQAKTAFEQLSKAWPSPVPPATPVISADEVAAKIKTIEQSTQPVITAAAPK